MTEASGKTRPATLRPARGAAGRGRRFVQIAIGFVACVLVVDAVFGERGLLEKMRARQQSQALLNDITRLKQENAHLREQARRLREDPRTIEEVARRELGLIRQGELVFIIKDVPSPHPPR
jgi:cell division protein FtsB